nr:MAG TPA: hypothetical protein [Caudoviricetes sp.]
MLLSTHPNNTGNAGVKSKRPVSRDKAKVKR